MAIGLKSSVLHENKLGNQTQQTKPINSDNGCGDNTCRNYHHMFYPILKVKSICTFCPTRRLKTDFNLHCHIALYPGDEKYK
mmetsp:Transcript_1/g.3  ORF Transcript_1/g.3 Transcript_1/m.3 type:complete len:82 (-) Transcript_1:40-285(-)